MPILGCLAWTAFAVTSRRSFRPGQYLLVGLEILFLVVIVAALVLSVLMKSWWGRSFKLLPPDTSAP